MTASIKGRVLSVIMAVAVALGLAVVAGSQPAEAANRDWLRRDATGTVLHAQPRVPAYAHS